MPLSIIPYEDKYQNQVMVLGMRSLLDDVDEDNRAYELEYLAKAFSKNLYQRWMTTDKSYAWVVVDDDTIVGYTSVIINNNVATINGMYILKPYRRKGFARELLQKAVNFAVAHDVRLMVATTTHYLPGMRRFLENSGFDNHNISHENDGKLTIYHYATKII